MPNPSAMLTGARRAAKSACARLGRLAPASAVMLIGVTAIAPAAARANASLFAIPDVPLVAAVGDRDVPGSILLSNANTAPDGGLTVCNAGDGGSCAGSEGITLTPSCGSSNGQNCSLPDSGVLTVHSPARGSDGTYCAGRLFLVTVIDAATGKLRFAPTGGAVVLPSPQSACLIEFTFDVLRFPSADLLAATAGRQTGQLAVAKAVSDQGSGAFGNGADALTVKAAPAITVSPSPGVLAGGAITDSVALDGEFNPTSGAIGFRLFGPDDPGCAGRAAFSAEVAINADGTATSPAFTPSATGTYRWIPSYGGDDNNTPATGACGEANQSVVTLPLACRDCDADGFAANVDCDDANPAIHPGAAERPGNRIDEDCSGAAADYPRLDSTVDWLGLRYRRAFVFTRLRIVRVSARSTIRLTCTGAGCPFKKRTRIVKASARTHDLLALVRRARLRPGARLEVRVTKPNTTGIVRRFTIRGRRGAKLAVDVAAQCLRPGAARPARCPL